MYRGLVNQIRNWPGRVGRFNVHDLLHADDPPHRLALGVALGIFFAFIPFFGIQMVFVVLFAWLLNANKLVGAPLVWLTNPATIVPIYYACYRVGIRILGQPGIGSEQWAELAEPPAAWGAAVTFYWAQLYDVALPMFLGSVVVGFAAACPAYLITYHAICIYRIRRWGQLIPPMNKLDDDDEQPVLGEECESRN
jgi:uncharacterized protein (DUF2062 family)